MSAQTIAALLSAPKPEKAPPPVVALQQQLPFNGIGWAAFEQLCARLMARRADLKEAERYGTPGQAQQGIDILARANDGSDHMGQCKDYKVPTTAATIWASARTIRR